MIKQKNASERVTLIIIANEYRLELDRTIETCLKQTYENIELIVVTQEEESYDKLVPQLGTVSYTKEEGYIAGYNKAVVLAEGAYIAIVKSGDLLMPKCIEIQLQKIREKESYVLVCADMCGINEAGTICYKSYYKKNNLHIYEKEQTKHLLQANFVAENTILMKKSIVEQVFPIPEQLPYVDWWIGVIASLHGQIGFTNKVLVEKRENGQGELGVNNKKHFIQSRVRVAQNNQLYYEAFTTYFRQGRYPYLSVIQPIELRDTLMGTYSLKKRITHYYERRTYMCKRKIRLKERMKIKAYLWMGPYLLMVKR